MQCADKDRAERVLFMFENHERGKFADDEIGF